MNCDQFTEAFQYRRKTSFLPIPMVGHLMACPRCRAYQQSLARQHRIARALPRPALPPALRKHVLENLPASTSPTSPQPILHYPLRHLLRRIYRTSRKWSPMKSVVTSSLCVAVAAVVWFALPRFSTPPAFATEVESAIGRANTWHYVGWRTQGGKKSKWEIWGRRQPFFYREQVGDDILLDNGTKRLRLLPPALFQKQGYAVSLPSQRLPLADSGDSGTGREETFIEGIAGGYLNNLYERSRTKDEVILGGVLDTGITTDESLLTVSTQTHLPVRYRLEESSIPMLPSKQFADKHGPKQTAAELEMNYNVAIPEAVTTLSIPTNYKYVDAHEGLLLHPRFLGRNAHGDLHIRIDFWLAGQRLGSGKGFPWFEPQVLLQCPPFTQARDARYPTDDLGQRYQFSQDTTNHSDYTDLWLKPLEPAIRHVTAAQSIQLPAVALLNFAKAIPDQYVQAIWTNIPVLRAKTVLTIPLQIPDQKPK